MTTDWLMLAGIACLIVGGLGALWKFTSDVLEDRRDERWARRSSYESVRDTFNYVVEEITYRTDAPLLDDEDHWLLQEALYDLRQRRAALV